MIMKFFVDRLRGKYRQWEKWGAKDLIQFINSKAPIPDQSIVLFLHLSDFWNREKLPLDDQKIIGNFCIGYKCPTVFVSGAGVKKPDLDRLEDIFGDFKAFPNHGYKKKLDINIDSIQLSKLFDKFVRSLEQGEPDFNLLYCEKDDLEIAFRCLWNIYIVALKLEGDALKNMRLGKYYELLKSAKFDENYWQPVLNSEGKLNKTLKLIDDVYLKEIVNELTNNSDWQSPRISEKTLERYWQHLYDLLAADTIHN